MNDSFTKRPPLCWLSILSGPGTDPVGVIGAIAPLKTYESNFIHHDFVQFREKHSRYQAILPSIILSHR